MSTSKKELTHDEQLKEDERKKQREEDVARKKQDSKDLNQRKNDNAAKAKEAADSLSKKKSSTYLYYYIVFAFLGFLVLYSVVMIFMNQTPPLHKILVIDEEKMEEHNQYNTWKQGPNKFFEGSTLADAKKLLTNGFASHSNLPKCSVDETITPPEQFHVNEKWGNCLHKAANQQKTCASSYAFTVSQTFSERQCIHSNSQYLYTLSAQELLSCDKGNEGCKSGHINVSLDYLKSKGLVEESCFPYEAESENTKCDKKCTDNVPQKSDGYCLLNGEDDIKRDIYMHGSAISVMTINIDMLSYKSGVYSKGEDIPKFSGFQSVKIVGWGVESGNEEEPNKGNKYWIIQNTWGEDWGTNGEIKMSSTKSQDYLFEQFAYSIRIKESKGAKSAPNDAPPKEIEEPKDPENLDLEDDNKPLNQKEEQ